MLEKKTASRKDTWTDGQRENTKFAGGEILQRAITLRECALALTFSYVGTPY